MQVKSLFDIGQALVYTDKNGKECAVEIIDVLFWDKLLGFKYLLREYNNNRTSQLCEKEIENRLEEVTIYSSVELLRKERAEKDA